MSAASREGTGTRARARVVGGGGCRWLCVVDTDGGGGGGGGGSEEKQGGYEKRGRSGERSLLPLLCVRNINDNHFSPDTGANPRRALCNTDRAAGTVLLFIVRFAPLDGTNKTG